MADGSTIGWTEATWNPTTGCDKVSAGCGLPLPGAEGEPHGQCYALTLAARLKAMGSAKYQNDGDPRTSGPGFGLTVHPAALSIPLRWRAPRAVFVNSMSDLFHAKVPREFLASVFAVMALTPRHTYQVLTKRPLRMCRVLNDPAFYLLYEDAVSALAADDETPLTRAERRRIQASEVPWPWPQPNVHLGVSVENQAEADRRIPLLLRTCAAVRIVSVEPLLAPVDLTEIAPGTTYADRGFNALAGDPRLDWVIGGGESGEDARPMDPDWARSLRDQCVTAGVPFFFKQWGGRTPKAGGRILDGRTWDEYPAVAPC